MSKFRKKPVVIEAVQFTGDNITQIENLLGFIVLGANRSNLQSFQIDTLEGSMRADVGDWIIKGVKGELYPCKPDIFEATYEEVRE